MATAPFVLPWGNFGTCFILIRLRDCGHNFLIGRLLGAPSACHVYMFIVLFFMRVLCPAKVVKRIDAQEYLIMMMQSV
jgi:hypothetical protein